MAVEHTPDTIPRPIALGFPNPGPALRQAYHDLWVANLPASEAKNHPELIAEQQQLGDPNLLPRPWEPATCTDRTLRWGLWLWLEAVADWINTEYVWDPTGAPPIPDCWPQHPHLVHELAVLADQRRRCTLGADSDLLENWHRYVLPGFVERMRHRLKQNCDDGTHQPWPGASRYVRFSNTELVERRRARFAEDARTLTGTRGRRLAVIAKSEELAVDLQTGELFEPHPD